MYRISVVLMILAFWLLIALLLVTKINDREDVYVEAIPKEKVLKIQTELPSPPKFYSSLQCYVERDENKVKGISFYELYDPVECSFNKEGVIVKIPQFYYKQRDKFLVVIIAKRKVGSWEDIEKKKIEVKIKRIEKGGKNV